MRLKRFGLALLALALTPAPALGAPTWLDETAPFGDVPARMQDADAAMAPDGTIVLARFTPDGALEVRERGATVTIEPVTVIPQPLPNLQVLAGSDGTAAVLFDAGSVRYAALRAPGGRWGRPEPLMPSRATRGQAALAPDGVLWGVGETPGEAGTLSVFRLPHAAPIPLPPVANDEVVAGNPSLTVPRAGVAHVIYIERLQTTFSGRCVTLSALRATDVTAAGAGPKRTLDVEALDGSQADYGCTVEGGAALFPPPRLTTDAAGGENVVYGVLAFQGAKQSWLAIHRDAGGDWGSTPEAVAADTPLRDLAGPAAVLGDAYEGLSIAVRGRDGRWRPSPLTGRTSVSTLRAVHSGAGTTVFAWSEGVAGGAAHARVLDADGVLGAPVTLNGGGTNVLGLGADAQGDAVALFSVQQPDQSFRLAARVFGAAGPGGTPDPGGGHAPPPPDTRPPALTRLSISRRPPVLRFVTDEAGRAHVALTKLCRRCPRRAVARRVAAGAARIPLGRLSFGTWRVTLTATDAAGNTAPAATRTVRITRGPSARAGR